MKIRKDRLVETASALIDVHSFTGNEQGMAELASTASYRNACRGVSANASGRLPISRAL